MKLVNKLLLTTGLFGTKPLEILNTLKTKPHIWRC